MSILLKQFSGRSISEIVPSLSNLRITVFREFPYLYEGSLDYEQNYLKTYVDSEKSLVIAVYDGDKLIGASTCLPLNDECDEFRKPFQDDGYDIEKIFYFGESIILPEYRGNKLGHEFFRLREEHAKKVNPDLQMTTFCAVERANDHPLRPVDYQTLDKFWLRQGYLKTINLMTEFSWKDLDKENEDAKPMRFWVKRWT